LKNVPLRGFDVILTPGQIFGDPRLIEKSTGVPTFKGPRYAADLPMVLNLYGEVELSKDVPACELLKERLREKVLEELSTAERDRDRLLSRPGNMTIGTVPVGKDFPMRVLAEIVDAPLLSDKEISERAIYYRRQGADMIDVGMVAGGGRARDAWRAVRAAKSAVGCPVSIDTLDPEEAKAGVEAGADLVLSLDAGNVEELSGFAKEVAVVVIPTDHSAGVFPKEPYERVEMMKRNIDSARKKGVTRILADLILDPITSPGFVKSLVSFYMFAKEEPEMPLFCGVGNVVELLDADTPGVNALVAGVASELGASLVLTTEASDKSRGSVGELATASKMMFLSKRRESPPTGLGIDLLCLKDQPLLEEPFDPSNLKGAREVKPQPEIGFQPDPKGCFKIMIDRGSGRIVAIHYPPGEGRPDLYVRGETAQEIYRALLSTNMVSDMIHSAYLGYELGKAEAALRSGKGYVQDSMLFNRRLRPSRPYPVTRRV
ncbi:MAG: dihydropteroate synthase-like protein, partial [Candidatus Bathyarchaeia archaeon]